MRTLALLLVCFPLWLSAQPQFVSEKIFDSVKFDSSYVYALPYAKGKSYLLIQGNGGWLSHKGEVALDFKMRRGTPVHAMREGMVIEIKDDSNRGGLGRRYFADGNYVLVRHTDNSFAWYFHLQKNSVQVHAGEVISKGQWIGRSGNSGYSAFPHLHVEVVVPDNGHFRQLPMRFQLRKDARFLRPGRYYRNSN
jgi:murein DD-endopeptidase MepM/ murein hydrolase activator NlpD